MIAVLFIPPLVTAIWLLAIRPYCVKHGKGYTPGAMWGVTLWVDWQEATALAKKRGDQGTLLICRIFLGLHVAAVALILLAILSGG